jgi:type III secretion protein C
MQQQHFGVHSPSQAPRLWRWLVRGIVAIGAFLLSVLSAWAAPIPFADRDVQLVAREQPVALFLQDLFGLIDLPVSVSPAVKGAVNGNFNGPAERVWRDVSRSLGVVSYYDGAVVHVYTPAELGTRTLPMSASVSERVLRTARELRMLDGRHSLRNTREGALVAMGTRRFLEELARSQSASLSASPPLGFKVFYLRYAWAQDVSINFGGRQTVVPGVAAIVRALMTTNPRSQVQIAPLEQMQRPTVPRLRGSGLAAQGGIAGANGTLGAAGANPSLPSADTLIAAYGGAPPPAGGGAPMGAWTLPANYSGVPVALGDAQQVRVEADTRLNAVIVRDAPERLPQYEQLINALDVEPQALEIEATIIDVDTDRLRELGVNWRLNRGRASLLLGEGNDNDRLLDGATVPPAGITPVGRGGFLSAVLGGGNELAVRLRALEEQGAAKVVSSPQVLTLSNVEAMFDTSRTFYVRVQGKDEVDLFSVSAGTTLRVTPHVFKDRDDVRIKLLVSIDDGALTQQQVDAIPVVERATINTQALIGEGESLLIGGLTREASRNGVQRVPLLGSIPLIGGLFRTSSESNQRTERMFLIVPRLAAAGRRAPQPMSPDAATSSPTPAPAPPPSAPAPSTSTPAEPGRQP